MQYPSTVWQIRERNDQKIGRKRPNPHCFNRIYELIVHLKAARVEKKGKFEKKNKNEIKGQQTDEEC